MRNSLAHDRSTAWLIAIAALGALVIAVFQLFPAFYSFRLGFYDAWLLRPHADDFIGLQHFKRLATDHDFWQALSITARYTIGTVSIATVVGLLLAAALRVPSWWSRLMQLGILIPSLLPTVVSGLLWKWLYDPYFGPINQALRLIGLSGPAWLKDPDWALSALIGMAVWRESGLALIIFLAALARIPPDVEAAARLDGASDWQRWRYVLLPLLRPATALVLLTAGLRCLEAFTPFFVLTGGGPAGATQAWSMYLYIAAFERQEIGYASAMALAVGIVLLLILWITRRAGRPEHEVIL